MEKKKSNKLLIGHGLEIQGCLSPDWLCEPGQALSGPVLEMPVNKVAPWKVNESKGSLTQDTALWPGHQSCSSVQRKNAATQKWGI